MKNKAIKNLKKENLAFLQKFKADKKTDQTQQPKLMSILKIIHHSQL